MSDPWDEFDPSRGTRAYLRWARSHGATTLGEAYDMFEHFEVGNDVPQVLGEDDSLDAVRSELEDGLESVGADASVASVL